VNPAQKFISIMTLASETSTATWAVLMVVVSALIAAVFMMLRGASKNLSQANANAEKHADDAQAARHNELKTLIGGVNKAVDGVAVRMDKVEGRVGDLEVGHGKLKTQLESMRMGGDRE
tara:strand:- start:569 stop:925 length:357 start_codon:yes stop_codon:yes gene_type:complete